MTFEQAADSFGWGELINFLHHLPEDSATYRALHVDAHSYASMLQQSAMLADIYDAIAGFAYMYSKAHNGNPRKPTRYKRPWATDDQKRIGSKPIPIIDFDDWYYRKGGE